MHTSSGDFPWGCPPAPGVPLALCPGDCCQQRASSCNESDRRSCWKKGSKETETTTISQRAEAAVRVRHNCPYLSPLSHYHALQMVQCVLQRQVRAFPCFPQSVAGYSVAHYIADLENGCGAYWLSDRTFFC